MPIFSSSIPSLAFLYIERGAVKVLHRWVGPFDENVRATTELGHSRTFLCPTSILEHYPTSY